MIYRRLFKYLRRHWFITLLFLLFLAYLFCGFFIVPRILQAFCIDLLREKNLQARIAQVRFNPLTINLKISGLEIRDDKGSELLSLEELKLKVSPASIWQYAVHINELKIKKPVLHLGRSSQGEWNIGQLQGPKQSDLVEPNEQTEASKKSSVRLIVDRVALAEGQINLTDQTRSRPFSFQLEELLINLSDFDNLSAEMKPLNLSAQTPAGEKISWVGELGLNPVRLRGEINLDAVRPKILSDLLSDVLPWDIKEGILDAKAALNFDCAQAPLKIELTDLQAELTDLQIVDLKSSSLLLKVPELKLLNGRVVLPEKQVALERFVAKGGALSGVLIKEGDEKIYQSIFFPRLGSQGNSATVGEEKQWEINVQKIAFEDFSFLHRDQTAPNVPELSLNKISLTLDNLILPPVAETHFLFSATVNQGGELKLDGDIAIANLESRFALSAEGVELSDFNHLLSNASNVLVNEGRVSLDGAAEVGLSNKGVRYQLQGRFELNDLKAATVEDNRELFSCKKFQVNDLTIKSEPQQISVAEIVVDTPMLSIIKEAKGVYNLSKLRVERETSEGPPTKEAAIPQKILLFRLDRLSVKDGVLKYLDEAVEPTVEVTLNTLDGEIADFATSSGKPFNFRISANGAASAKVLVSGNLTQREVGYLGEVELELDEGYLPLVSPYFGWYFGRNVAQGDITVKLKYQSDGSVIEGQNGIILKRLEFGDKVESPDSLGIPIELVAAIMQDRSGTITINFPVDGDLTQPNFNFSGVIAEAALNTLSSVVSSPFTLLASLAGTEMDLSRSFFEFGESELSELEKERLSELASALELRPELALTITPVFDSKKDKRALAKIKLREDFFEQGAKGAKQGVETDRETVLTQDYTKFLLQLYQKQYGYPPGAEVLNVKFPAVEKKHFQEVSGNYTADYLAALQEAVIKKILVSEEELDKLSLERGWEIKKFVQSKGNIAENRLRLRGAEAIKASGSKIFILLSLGAENE